MARSADPDKAARQAAGLRKGRETMALRVAKELGWVADDFDPSQGTPPAPTKAPTKASPGSKPRRTKAPAKAKRDVVDYDQEPSGARTKAPTKPPTRGARGGGGFLDGLFGG